MSEIDREKWREKYKELCCELLKMTELEAKLHLATAVEFDYGYSPFWYVMEEMNVNFYEKHMMEELNRKSYKEHME